MLLEILSVLQGSTPISPVLSQPSGLSNAVLENCLFSTTLTAHHTQVLCVVIFFPLFVFLLPVNLYRRKQENPPPGSSAVTLQCEYILYEIAAARIVKMKDESQQIFKMVSSLPEYTFKIFKSFLYPINI